MRFWVILVSVWLNTILVSHGQEQIILEAMRHVRNAEPREWSEFPVKAEHKELLLDFYAHANKSRQTISLRQYDVKLDWAVMVNGKVIGSLATDEKDMVIYLDVPPGTLREGQNKLLIRCGELVADDILVGEIKIHPRPLATVLSDASLSVEIYDANSDILMPSKITIVNHRRSLQSVSSGQSKHLAIRPGVVYTATGKASLSLPAGAYTVYAGRGSAYGIDSANVTLKAGDEIKKVFRINKEVSTAGWISSDTHIHTLTHSGHGDATLEERAITIAGEGIELPVLTDHNVHVDLTAAAKAMQVDKYFTTVIGNEYTTKVGHFNIFKTTTLSPLADQNVSNWTDVASKIQNPDNAKAIILNHARDVHNNFRPFGPGRHLSSVGMSPYDWPFPANAMEVINSGSQQSNFMNLFNDWFGMLNHGIFLTPVGSSDSHDVSRYIVGQGRTYIKSEHSDPGKIDVDAAIKNFTDGKVLVSCGLLTKILVNERYGPGDLGVSSNNLTVDVEVHGPSWVEADRVTLFMNGIKTREDKIKRSGMGGLLWKVRWEIPSPKHDVFLVAVAEGTGDANPYWAIAKPYQPASADWTPRFIGSTGAVWIDADNNKTRNAAVHYAKEIIRLSANNIYKTINLLTDYDMAVAMQVAGQLWKEGRDLNSHEMQEALAHAQEHVRNGFEKVINEIKLLKM